MDSINKIKEYIDNNFSEKRRTHTYGVRDTAVHLAKKYGLDPAKAEVAALLHDMFRGVAVPVLDYHVNHLGLDKKYIGNPNLSHGKIAAVMIQRDFGVKDEDIINAVSFHTTGRAGMSLLEKIIYVADAIEPGRSYPGVEEIRRAAEEDIDKACLISLAHTIEYVRSDGKYLDEDTVYAKKYFEDILKQKGEKDDQ